MTGTPGARAARACYDLGVVRLMVYLASMAWLAGWTFLFVAGFVHTVGAPLKPGVPYLDMGRSAILSAEQAGRIAAEVRGLQLAGRYIHIPGPWRAAPLELFIGGQVSLLLLTLTIGLRRRPARPSEEERLLQYLSKEPGPGATS